MFTDVNPKKPNFSTADFGMLKYTYIESEEKFMKKAVSFLLSLILVAVIFPISSTAEEMTKEKEYKALDLVVVVDSSGSMLSSDPERMAPDAVRMLTNMMPAEDSRVGLISFNEQPTVLTTTGGGEPTLISLEDFTGVETIRTDIDSVEYNGGTGIGNALNAATQLLNDNSQQDRSKAIILFTDGVNDFDNDKIAMAACDDNEATAVKWAKENACPIYCVGYNYIMPNGESSMGENGEGLQKLESIAANTNGQFKQCQNIEDMEQMLIEFLADVCDVIFDEVDTIPGDGGYHECSIDVSPSVVEVNIRIKGGDKDAIKNGDVHLYSPDGNEIKLENSDNVRYDVDATAASIKVLFPQSGNWLLTVNGINGEDIKVSRLEHFKMNLTSELIFPQGNPVGVAYSNDNISIRAWLTYDGADITDTAIYDTVISATATCVSRADQNDVQTVQLTRDGNAFTGSFTIPEDCYYDVTIRLDWDTVYREDTLTVASSNKPVTLVNDMEDVSVNKNKTVEITDIYKYVNDDEGDAVSASVLNVAAPDVADAVVDGNTLKITGKKWSSTLVTVQYRDEQGNTVETTFKVKVHDPVAMALIIGGIVLLVIAALLILYLLKKASERVSGAMKIVFIANGRVDGSNNYKSTELIYENPNISHDINMADDWHGGQTGNWSPTDSQSSPFENADNPFGNTADPFGNAVDTSSPFAEQSSDAFSADSPFDFGGSDPFGQGTSFGGSEPFENTESDIDKTADDNDIPIEKMPHDAFQQQDANTEQESNRSNSFDEKISIGGSRVRKTDLKNVLNRFAKTYREYMEFGGKSSAMADKINNFIMQYSSAFSKIKMLGTLYGKGGVILKPDKDYKKSKLIIHSPSLIKGKAAMNPKRGKIRLAISVLTGEKAEDGSIPCAHIEIEYGKKY